MATERSTPDDPATDATGTAPKPEPEDATDATAEEPSVGDLVREATTNLSTLVRGEVELAKMELTGMVKRIATGSAMFAVAGAVVLWSLLFPFIALAEAFVALGLPRWVSYLIVWGILLVLAGLAALIGVRIVKRASKPERTIETVKDTAHWARHPTRDPGAGVHSGTPTAHAK